MSVQDILLQQAMQDNRNKPDPAAAMAAAGSGSALLGVLSGRGVKGRMAGGLGGLILGGGLGAGLAKMMEQSIEEEAVEVTFTMMMIATISRGREPTTQRNLSTSSGVFQLLQKLWYLT